MGQPMARCERSAAAALLLFCLLAVPALAPPGPASAACPDPVALPAAAGAAASVACAAPIGGSPLRGAPRLLFGQRLDPNRAAPGALEALPGIGPVRAAAIAAERCRRPFASAAELERVHGVGPRTRLALEPWLEVEESAATGPLPARCPVLH